MMMMMIMVLQLFWLVN